MENGFDWSATVSLYIPDDDLQPGERVGDPIGYQELDRATQITRGHVASDVVMTFLKAVAALRPKRDVMGPRYDSFTHRAHASITTPGAEKPAVVSMRDGVWMLNDHGLGVDDALDKAWKALVASLEMPPPGPPALPPNIDTLPTAPVVVLSYANQQRRWRINDLRLAIDPGETRGPYHASINGPYRQLLGAIDAHVAP